MRPIHFLLLALLPLLVSCTEYEKLPNFPLVGQVVVGQLKSEEIAGVMAKPDEILRLVDFANAQRLGRWSNTNSVHGKCSLKVTFLFEGKPAGYLALEGDSFFTDGPSGQVSKPAGSEEAGAFIALIPTTKRPVNYWNGKCVG